MADIKQALYTRLTGFAGLSALIGTRLYPREAPEGAAFSYIVFHRISRVNDYHLTGFSGITAQRFQFDVYATTEQNIEAVLEQLRLALDGFDGDLSGNTVFSISYDGQIDRPMQGAKSAQDLTIRRTAADFVVQFCETIPA